MEEVDHLTGLQNRLTFMRNVEAAMTQGHRGAILFIDVDNAAHINQILGFPVLDDHLVQLARLLESLVADAPLARLSGDEFAVYVRKASDAPALAERVRSAVELAPRFCLLRNLMGDGRHRPALTVSIGISASIDGGGVKTLLLAAEEGAFKAKIRGRNCLAQG